MEDQLGKQRRCRSLVVLAVAFACAAGPADAIAKRPGFSVTPAGALGSGFSWGQRDYAPRCAGERPVVRVRGESGWEAKVGSGGFREGDFAEPISQRAGKQTTVSFRRLGHGGTRLYHLRCLPAGFPAYEFDRSAAGGPKFFAVQLADHYAAIFDRNGVPVYWYEASGEADNFQVLADKTITFDPVDEISFQTGDYEVRSLRGNLIRTVRGANGAEADIHEILLLKNGNYVIGSQVRRHGIDTSQYGGTVNSSVIDTEIQELTPEGALVSSWDSGDHTGLEETGRWWSVPFVIDNPPYDISHWNSVDIHGRFMYLSYRHLDAVYKVDRTTGEIIWKLGGTPTAQSLEVLNDPHGDYPLGAQHDARLLPDGSITIFDNRSGLGEPARAVRYKIDEAAGTATLVQEIVDPEVPFSLCCGSADRLPSGDWLVGWGGVAEVAGDFARAFGTIGAYDKRGTKLFELYTPDAFSYRANPLAEDLLGVRRLRDAMDAMVDRPG